ncbi:MAG: hypothetical protein RIC35_24655 [Marinoscillum sp.]
MMMKLDQRQIQHLLLRCGFGDNYSVVKRHINQPADNVFEHLLQESKQPGIVSIEAAHGSSKDEEESKKSMQQTGKQGRKNVKTFNTLWIKEMSTSPSHMANHHKNEMSMNPFWPA